MAERVFHLNIAICDDEKVMLDKLQAMCSEILGDTYSLSFCAAQTSKEILDCEQVFELALLDVQLLEESGLDLAKEILARNSNCRIIFVSGYTKVVSDVYDVPHFCFILKEQLDANLPKFLTRAAQLAAQEAGMRVAVRAGKQILQLSLKDIVFIERRGHWTYINLSDGTVVSTREKLSELHSRIGSADFVRCHISYIVNLCYVKSLERKAIFLLDGTEISISLPHELEVREAFFRHLGK